MKTVEDAVRHFNGKWDVNSKSIVHHQDMGLCWWNLDFKDALNPRYQFVCTREQFEVEAERLGYRRELNPTTSSVTDNQAREFAEESGTCSDGLTCGPTYCDLCPNRNTVDDPVNHPTHYTSGEIECIDAIRAALAPEEFRGFCKGNVIKYVWRSNLKGDRIKDQKKALWYLNRLVDNDRDMEKP